MIGLPLASLAVVAVIHAAPLAAQARYSAQRARMLVDIAAMARESGGATGRPVVTAAAAEAPKPLIDQHERSRGPIAGWIAAGLATRRVSDTWHSGGGLPPFGASERRVAC
jgi:hypothetical protein